MTALPRGVMAETTDIKQCLRDIQVHWLSLPQIKYKGTTRVEKAPCELLMNLSSTTLTVHAIGLSGIENTPPQIVSFKFKDSSGNEKRNLLACKVNNERMSFVFEEKTSTDFEKRAHVQMDLIKGHGKGMSMILSKRDNKILRPLQQKSLICHFN